MELTMNHTHTHIYIYIYIYRDSERIDYIFGTSGPTTFIRHRGILPFDVITPSNHIGLFLDVDLTIFLKDFLHQYVTNTDILIRTNNPKCVH